MTKLFSFWLTALFAAAVGVALALVPLLGIHGVESALVLGVLLPPWVAATAASYARKTGSERGVDMMFRAISSGLFIWLIPVGILALNSLRIRQCAPLEGLAFMVLGPAVGCALAACVGVWVTALLNGSRFSPWVGAAVPLGGLAWGLWAFYASPAVYVFGAFAGYFPGAIYDELVQIPTRYLTYRAAIVLAIIALVLLFDALWNRSIMLLDFRGRGRRRLGAIAVSIATFGLVVGSYWNGDHLGHWVSADYVAERLGKTEHGQHCVVHMPRETQPEFAARLVEDCDFHVERTRKLLGLESEEPITVFLFRHLGEKRDLIGAGRTLVAKPWRREVYLQMAGWPHPVLGHEIVHAVLGDVARGPFALAAKLGGLLPNPGMIEGAAVALAWDLREDMDPDQWSRIMMDREELPATGTVMSLRFSTLPARRAYMAAGSLTRFLIATRGAEAFVRAYRRGAIEALGALEQQWLAYLEGVSVSEHERGVAEVALAKPSIFTAVCPHMLAELRADLSGDEAAGDDRRTIQTCESILSIDENEAQARASLVGALARTGREDQALAELQSLEEAVNAPKPIIAAALEQFADATWTLGRLDEAAARYEQLLAIPRTDGPARQSEVKKLALAAGEAEQALIYQMLIERSSAPVVVHLAQGLSTLRDDGLGPYLEARQLMGQNRFELALPLLHRARELGLPTARLQRELSRMLAITLYAVGNYAESEEVWNQRRSISRAADAEAQLWVERIEFAETGKVNPTLPGPSSAPPTTP